MWTSSSTRDERELSAVGFQPAMGIDVRRGLGRATAVKRDTRGAFQDATLHYYVIRGWGRSDLKGGHIGVVTCAHGFLAKPPRHRQDRQEDGAAGCIVLHGVAAERPNPRGLGPLVRARTNLTNKA
jgi:hypothetical protein